MDSVLISVIIPAYNCAAYIACAVRSVLTQTEQRFEIVIIDDASSDTTLEIIREFHEPCIRLYVNTHNQGPSYTRNRAIQLARGQWIALLDADDWYAPERLEILLKAAEQCEADMVADNLYLVPAALGAEAMIDRQPGAKGRPRAMRQLFSDKMKQGLPRQLTAAEFIRGNIPGTNSPSLGLVKPFIRREFLLRHGLSYDQDIKLGEDTVFYLSCLARGARFTFVPEPCYFSLEDRVGSLREHNGNNSFAAIQYKYKINERLLKQEYCVSMPEIKQALLLHRRSLERLMAFQRLKLSIKNRSVAGIWQEILYHPGGLMIVVANKVNLRYRKYRRRLKHAPTPLAQVMENQHTQHTKL